MGEKLVYGAGIAGHDEKLDCSCRTDGHQPARAFGAITLPDFLQSIVLKYVMRGYRSLPTFTSLMIVAILTVLAMKLIGHLGAINEAATIQLLWNYVQHMNHFCVIVFSGSLLCGFAIFFLFQPRRVYLVDFACQKPDEARSVSKQGLLDYAAATGRYSEQSLDFQQKILERSGIGDNTYLPPVMLELPPRPSMKEAREEAKTVMCSALDELFAKTGVKPKDIRVLVVNVSLFNPTPSLSAMVVNHYKMRGDIKSINIGGMGCSAGLIAIDLAKDLLQVHRNSYALVLSQEILSLRPYFGNHRSKLVTNCLFRMGGAAILLSNKMTDRRHAKYELMHTVRTHKGADEKSYQCVVEDEDEDGQVGVSLSKDLMSVAGDALKANITTLGPLVLPYSEQLRFLLSLLRRKLSAFGPQMHKKYSLTKPYIPDFKLAFEHFCIHAGGRAVLDELEKNLNLSEWQMEPSRMTLYRFGNTSSSSLWYELAYTEAKARVQRGDRLWQIAFGSGFKCNSAVWRALRTIKPPSAGTLHMNPWSDSIHNFPVKAVAECKLERNPRREGGNNSPMTS